MNIPNLLIWLDIHQLTLHQLALDTPLDTPTAKGCPGGPGEVGARLFFVANANAKNPGNGSSIASCGGF
jgi:hypothetical protein